MLLRYKPGSGISSRVVTPEVNEIVVNPNATLDWQLALRQAAGKTDLARNMLQMLLDFLPELCLVFHPQQLPRHTWFSHFRIEVQHVRHYKL